MARSSATARSQTSRRGRPDGRKLADLVRKAVDDGATTVEEIHKSIAALPLDVLERLDVFEETVKDVRKVQESSIGAVYDLIRKVNREAAGLARELLDSLEESQRGTARKTAPRASTRKPATAKRATARRKATAARASAHA